MGKFPLRISEGHLITTIDDANFIIDTGTSTSYSCSGRIDLSIGGCSFSIEEWPFSNAGEIISNLVRLPIAGLIGLDIMEELGTVKISKNEGYVIFGDKVTSSDYEQPFHLEGHNGHRVITTDLKVNRRAAKVILDTGARIDYMDTTLLDTSEMARHETDYNPIIGLIEADGYETIYGIGDMEFETISYAATAILRTYVAVLNISDLSGVVGLNAFLESMKSITLDFRNRKFIFQA